MHPIITTSCLCLAAASLPAQTFLELPLTAGPSAELGSYSLLPLTVLDSRLQVFYDQAEVGSASFTATEIALRYDGPIPAVGLPGPFQIARLRIRIGVSSIANPGADFAGNLTQPLTTVLDAPWSYLPDNGSMFPHPWGGPGGTLTFPFTTPVPIVVGAGEWLVIEMIVEGNTLPLSGLAHPMLDGAVTIGGFVNGNAVNYGQGCAAGPGAANATASTSGLYGPGGAHTLSGQNLGANAPVFAIYGFSNPSFLLPGTSCTLLESPDVTIATLADATGAVSGAAALTLTAPVDPTLSGVVLYEQLASLVVGANPWAIVFSDAVTVSLGSWTPPGRGTHLIAHDSDANATYANSIRPFGYALRLRTL